MRTDSTGIVFDIQHFSVSDGPGIRTVVFLKGCPLRCSWCHNPESYRFHPQLMVYRERCVNCGGCTDVCPQKIGGIRLGQGAASGCTACGQCVSACPADALEMAGQSMTTEEVMQAVMEDASFYQTSGGGLTLSGGEPMAQADFALSLAQSAREQGLHVCLETSGYCPRERLLDMTSCVDLFLYDYKVTGDALHRQCTGVSQQLILDNLRALDEAGAAIILRCPIIPGINLNDGHISGIIELTRSLSRVQQIHLEPYHKIGLSKRTRLNMEDADTIPVPERPQLSRMAEQIARATYIETLVM